MPGSTGVGVSPYVPTSFDAGTNQNRGGGGAGWSASSYDAYGNVIQDSAGNTFAYDAENRQTSAGGTTYGYDGYGQRVQRTSSSGTSTYIYDVFGNMAAEYDTQATPMTGTIYLTPDQLGSTRLVSDSTTLVNLASPGSPGMALECRDYLPFGEQLTVGRSQMCAAADAGVRQLYTGQERDTETNLDFLNARYLSTPQGRFTSPDPDNAGADPAYPQSWNMYSYVRNNPLKYIDPFGLCSQDANGNFVNDDNGGTFQFSGPCVQGNTVTATAPPVAPDTSGFEDQDFLNTIFSTNVYTYGISASPTQQLNIGAGPGPGGTQNSCVGSALLKGALNIGIDAIGLIPEAKGFTKVFENTAGYQIARAAGNSAGYRWVVATQYGMKAVNQGKGAVAFAGGALGLGDSGAPVLERISGLALSVAGFTPLGQVAAAASIGVDIYRTAKAIRQCP